MSTGSAMARLKTMVSRSAMFQTLSGTIDEAGAAALIFLEIADATELPRDGDKQLTDGYALIISVDEDERSESIAGGSQDFFDNGGDLKLELVSPRAGANDAADALAFRSVADDIRSEVLAQSGLDDALRIRNMSKPLGPYAEPEEAVNDLGLYYFIDLTVGWGFV